MPQPTPDPVAATSDPMTSVHGLRRLFHRHRWIQPKSWTFAAPPPEGVFEFCGRCGKERVRPYFLVAGE